MKLLQTTPKCVLNLQFEAMKSLVGLCSLDLENETFSQHHFNNKFKAISDFKRLYENLQNGWIDLFKTLTMYT